MSSLPVPSPVAGLCAAFVSVLPVQHAAISTLGPPFEVETICSTSAMAARLDERQLDLGEGPCWQARTTRAPVLVPDLHRSDGSRWPTLHAGGLPDEIRSAYAFPLLVGSLDIGAVALYATTTDAMSSDDVAEASTLAGLTAIHVLHHALDQVADAAHFGATRRVVHQATGMVIAQLGVTAEDALLIIRAHAFAADRTVREVSADIVARTIAFDTPR